MSSAPKFPIELVASLCHEVNRAFCVKLGDHTQAPWETAPDWQRESAISGVKHRLENPLSHPSASHENWMREKLAAGWVYGPEKSAEKRTHPCLVEFAELPPEQRAKDYLFTSTVLTLRELGMIEGVR